MSHPLQSLIGLRAAALETRQPPGGQSVADEAGAVSPVPVGAEASVSADVAKQLPNGVETVAEFPQLRDGYTDYETDWPEPCPVCDSMAAWWDFRGQQHCQRCEAKQFARGLRGQALAVRMRLKSIRSGN